MGDDSSTGVGIGRIATAVALGLVAVGLCIGAVFPALVRIAGDAVSWPDFFLAVGSSAAVASVFFFLSAQVKRVVVRTDEAIGQLRREMSSLGEQLQQRATERAQAAQLAARALIDSSTVSSLLELSNAAAERGLGAALCVALRDRFQLSLQSMWVEGHVGPVEQTHWLGVEEVAPQVSDPREPVPNPVSWHRRQLAVVNMPPTGSLTDTLEKLHADLDAKQASWPEFSYDAELALENLSVAMESLFRVDGPKVGTVEVVLDQQFVMTRTDLDKRLLVDVHDPIQQWLIAPELSEAAEEPGALAILWHPLVARHLDYQRSTKLQKHDLLGRKRATRAMSRQLDSGP